MDAERSEYIAGLRTLADLLESSPDLALPSDRQVSWYLFGEGPDGKLSDEEQKARATALVRLLPGPQTKQETGDLFRFRGTIGGLRTQVIVDRNAVCRRVVTGTREVTKTIPTATEDVTVTEDVVEWICEPLLAEASS